MANESRLVAGSGRRNHERSGNAYRDREFPGHLQRVVVIHAHRQERCLTSTLERLCPEKSKIATGIDLKSTQNRAIFCSLRDPCRVSYHKERQIKSNWAGLI